MAKISNYVYDIATYFKNVTLNAVGVRRNLYELLDDGDVKRAISLMDDNGTDVDNALKEYNPQLHKIMKRANKWVKGKGTYVTVKVPLARQRYINEVELFFLLGQPVKFSKLEGDDEAYKLFTDFIREYHWDSKMRTVKRLAGAETESAKLYRLYKDVDEDGKETPHCELVVLSRSKGYQLRPLFDQYGNLVAFAYGYKLKDSTGRAVQHWDIQTPQTLYFCERSESGLGWSVEKYANPTGKINVIYYKQRKAWDGVEPLMEREEEIHSKQGDTNNYFADPVAIATADVVESLCDPHTPAKLMQATSSQSRFEYITPPQASEARVAEEKFLEDNILFGTFTPDFHFEKLSGIGGLTGRAIKNSFILAYIKRENLKETYCEMLGRDVSIIKEVLKLLHPTMADKIDALKIDHEFSEPFSSDEHQEWAALSQLYGAGLISLETAVERMALTHAPQEEIDRIRMAQMEQLIAQNELAAEQEQEKGTGQHPEQVDEEGKRVLTRQQQVNAAIDAANKAAAAQREAGKNGDDHREATNNKADEI